MAGGRRQRVSRLTRLLESEKALATALLAPGVVILALFIAYLAFFSRYFEAPQR